ncbi:sugar transferase [uncultured Campylobacter sp.]|uniref:sugar transferase n=1 Tax=uncultured Campylobacter sp. TaxID=218934 RepID=UPI00261C7CF8|nr:sugar transferase [uncultured Campylobacter sp.]
MLVLGRKYKFTEMELERLHKKFSEVNIVKYSGRSSRDVRLEIEDLLKSHNYKFLVINTKEFVDPKMIKFLTLLQFRFSHKRIKILSIEKFLEKFFHKCYIPEDDRDLEFLSDIRPYNSFEYTVKRIIDYIGGSILYILFIVIKFYVKKKINEESPGSIYFLQKRVGLNNREFVCVKFRSMKLDAEKYGAKFADENDKRIFSFGKFMRRTRIDEIPQCINVIKGEMHLIGPRPERRYWINFFEKEIPYYNERHLVCPGITGWAQVNYPYGASTEDAKQKLMYDLYYIKYWSLWLEVKTILMTVFIVIRKKGV